MNTLPLSEQHSEQLPDPLFEQDAQIAATPDSKADIEAAVGRFWDTVRKSADVIVTLRQENMMVNAQNQALRESEQELQNRIDELQTRIASLDTGKAKTGKVSIDPTAGQLQAMQKSMTLQAEELTRLQAILVVTEAKLCEAHEHRADNSRILEQLAEAQESLERAQNENQMNLFSPQVAAGKLQEPAVKQLMTEQEIADLAARLDNVADSVAQLLGIS